MATTYPPIARTQPRPRLRGLLLPLGIAALLAGIALAAFLGLSYWRSLISVTIVVDGRERMVRAPSQPPAGILNHLGYQPRPEDKVTITQLRPGARIEVVRARPVLIAQGGISREAWTHATTVGDFLVERGIRLGSRDLVQLNGAPASADAPFPPTTWTQPRPGLPHMPWERTAAPLHLVVRRAAPVTLIDGDALPATFFTLAPTVGEALEAAETPIYQGDVVFPPLHSRLLPGQRIVIKRSLPIQVSADSITLATRTRQRTVGDALAEQNISVVGLDTVTPPLDAPLKPYTNIQIVRVREDVVYEEERIPFETVWRPDDNLPIDQRQVVDSGHEGVLRKRFRIRYENGIEVARSQEDSWAAADPQNKIIAYGRKIVPLTLDTPDGPITYWRHIRSYATSYSPARSGTPRSAPWYGRTRIGLPLRQGLVAIDPSVISMRTQMYIPGYGYGMAADTGGGVRGKHIDLGYEDHNYVAWHWWTDVYLLWPPPPAYAINYVLPDWPRYPDRRK